MPKRPRNLVQRGAVYYYRRKVGGRSIRVSLGSDYQEAVNRLRSLTFKELPSTGTVEEAATRWLETYIKTNRRREDWGLAGQRVRDYLVPFMGHHLLSRLKSEDLRGYRLWLHKRTLSAQSVRHILSDCRCFLNWCVESGQMEHSPFPRRLLPKVQERPPDRLTDEEVEAVCSVPDPYGMVCRILVTTGLRWSEAVRAKASDIQGGFLVVHQTKSGKVRRVPAYGLPQVGRLIPFKSEGAFARMVRKLSRVEGFHVHQLRHSFACRWIEAGGSLAALQELLGHSTIVTTQRYARLSEAHVQDEVRRLRGVTVGVTAAEAGKA
jgi:integrase